MHETLEIAKKTNFNISLLQIGAKLYHKSGNFLLPIMASVIKKLGQFRFITNWGSYFYYKLGQLLLQIGAAWLLQIRASFITNQGNRYYKLGQLLQIGAIMTNWSITNPFKKGFSQEKRNLKFIQP